MAKKGSPESSPHDNLVRAIEVSAATAVLVGVAYRYLHHKEDAEDAAQNAYEKALRKVDKFRGESEPDTWLHRIVLNSAKDLRNSWYMRHHLPVGDTDFLSIEDIVTSADPEEELLRSESYRQVIESLTDLSPRQREVLVRAVFLDQSHEEIAAALNIPIGTSKATLHRALKKVR